MDQEVKAKYKSHMSQLSKMANAKSDKLYSWYKQVLIMASGLLSVLIALHSKRSDFYLEHLTFIISVISLSVGIVTGSIFLFSEVNNASRAQKDYSEQAIKDLHGEIPNGIVVSGNVSKIFVIFEWISYLCFLLALISLCYYAILSDIMIG